MIADLAQDEYELSTGTRLYANNCIIGLDPAGNVSGGYDQDIPEASPGSENYEHLTGLTPAERVELADYMIERWQAYRATYAAPESSSPPVATASEQPERR